MVFAFFIICIFAYYGFHEFVAYFSGFIIPARLVLIV